VARANTCSSSFWTRIELRSGLILVIQVYGRGLNCGPG